MRRAGVRAPLGPLVSMRDGVQSIAQNVGTCFEGEGWQADCGSIPWHTSKVKLFYFFFVKVLTIRKFFLILCNGKD